MTQLRDDCFAGADALMPLDEALGLLERALAPVTGIETVRLRRAAGRLLVEDVASDRDVPPHDNSAVDGYAVYFDDLDPKRETRLPVVARVVAGQPAGEAQRRGTAVRIFTGAPMPPGADGPGPETVMMQEDCRAEDGVVVITPGIKRGANRRLKGEDVTAGSTVLRRGARLRAQDVGLAASVGRTELDVFEPLKAAVFSTGNEIRDPGGELAEGCIFDANRFTLIALLEGLGCTVTDLGILADDLAIVRGALKNAAASHQIVLSSGGVSTGEEDHVTAAVEALGSLHFWCLAIKPGRPLAMGQIGVTPFVGLPGNPVAMMVTFLRVARPAVLRLAGAIADPPRLFRVRSGFDHDKKPGRREWVRARLETAPDGTPMARKFPRDGAGVLSSMVESDGLVELPEELTRLTEGAMVDFLSFDAVIGR